MAMRDIRAHVQEPASRVNKCWSSLLNLVVYSCSGNLELLFVLFGALVVLSPGLRRGAHVFIQTLGSLVQDRGGMMPGIGGNSMIFLGWNLGQTWMEVYKRAVLCQPCSVSPARVFKLQVLVFSPKKLS